MVQRYIPFKDMTVREAEEDIILEGYFAVFDSIYELWPGHTESIAKGAFDGCMEQDVRALWNHNQDIVLGRTGAGTLTLEADDIGLKGAIRINRQDQDAMNAAARVRRQDCSGCSFGFEIGEESADYREDGTVHWTITRISKLYEVSPCVFPAYEETSINARKKEVDDHNRRKLEVWRKEMRDRVKGGRDGD